MPESPYGRSNRWLTVILIKPEEFGADRETVRVALEAENIEAIGRCGSRHLQPVFQVERLKAESRAKQKRYKTRVVGGSVAEDLFDPQITQIDADYKRYPCRVVGGEVAEDLFERGLCLPSGTAMTNGDLDRVIGTILKSRAKALRG